MLEPLGVNQVKLEAIASALVVGMRVDRYLALRAQGDLENAEELGDVADALNTAELARFADVRGIRIEDDVLITETGSEVLTAAIPKTIAEVEAAVR